jgi:hypothetical protein
MQAEEIRQQVFVVASGGNLEYLILQNESSMPAPLMKTASGTTLIFRRLGLNQPNPFFLRGWRLYMCKANGVPEEMVKNNAKSISIPGMDNKYCSNDNLAVRKKVEIDSPLMQQWFNKKDYGSSKL